jgi:hypothetical protein
LAGLEPVRKRARVHFLLGLATALTTVLVNSISVTYLIGTCRWCKEVVDAYGLSDHLVQQSLQLKRHTFPWSLAGMLAILCIVTLGAAADPATLRADTATWVVPHATAAVIGAGLIAWAFFVQALNLHRYAKIIDTVLREVREVRRQRGLEVEDEPVVV